MMQKSLQNFLKIKTKIFKIEDIHKVFYKNILKIFQKSKEYY